MPTGPRRVPTETRRGPQGARRGWSEGRAARVVAVVACAAAILFIALPELALARVRHLLDTRQHEGARRWLAVADLTSPRRGAVHFQAARLARRQGDFAAVRRRLEAALAAGWPVDDLRREQWLAQAQTGQVDAMHEHWPALFSDPGSDGPEISRAFVVAALARIRLDDARRVLDAWEADYPADPGPHAFRGIIHAIQLEWDDAARAYTRALELDPGDVAARRGLAEAFSKRLQFAEALDAWTAVLAADPRDTAAAVGRCDCLVRLGEIDTARRELSALIARGPDDVAALEVAGRLELAAGDAAQAVEHLRRACDRRPEDAELRYAFGRALRLAGDGAAAREHLAFREAAAEPLERLRTLLVDLPRDPWNADLRAEIGELTYRWRSREEGLQWMRRALDVDPGHAAARALLESHRADAAAPLPPSAPAPPVPSVAAPAAPAPGPLRLVDRAADRGLVFTSVNGERHDHLTILESLGSGVGLVDYDADGADDVFAVGGGDFAPGAVRPVGVPDALFRNDGRGRFSPVTEAARAAGGGFYAHGVNVGDYDADGLPDLLVTGYEGVALLHNLGDGTFRSVPPSEHGIPGDGWLTSSAWLDVDGDGHLDLYLVRYCDWSPANDPPCRIQGQRDVCPPAQFAGVDDRLLLGDGRGGFIDAGGRLGLVAGGKGLGVVAADLDLDGDTDLYVANDTTANVLYRNDGAGSTPRAGGADGAGRLTECGLLAGVAMGPTGEPEGSMGVDVGDANLDGLPDLWVANFENQSFGLYRNFGGGVFEHVSAVAGITAVGAVYVGFGTMFLDVDLDGAEDLFVANGHVMRFPKQAPLLQRPLLFHNRAGRRMENVADSAGDFFTAGHRGRGAAAGDLDGDGDDDIVVSRTNEPLALLINESPRGAVPLAVRLVGTTADRDAIGASAVLETTSRRMLRQVKGGGSYLSSSSRRLVWGLAPDERPLRLVVRWPGGRETVTPLEGRPEPAGGRGMLVREDRAERPVELPGPRPGA